MVLRTMLRTWLVGNTTWIECPCPSPLQLDLGPLCLSWHFHVSYSSLSEKNLMLSLTLRYECRVIPRGVYPVTIHWHCHERTPCSGNPRQCLVAVVGGLYCSEKAGIALMYHCNAKRPGKEWGASLWDYGSPMRPWSPSVRTLCIYMLHSYTFEVLEQEEERRWTTHSLFLSQRESHQRRDPPRKKKTVTIRVSHLLPISLFSDPPPSDTSEKTLVSSHGCLECGNV